MFGRHGADVLAGWRRFGQLALAFGLFGALSDQAATLLRGPYLQNVQSNRASVLWTTRESGAGQVVVTDGQTKLTVAATVRAFLPEETHLQEAFYQYEADLAGLRAGSTYQYHILFNGMELGQAADAAPALHFTTPSNGRFAFLALGDSGSGSSEQLKLAARMQAEPDISMVVHVGDLAYGEGTFGQFEKFYFAPYRTLMSRVPFFPTPGNHEYYTDGAAAYFSVNSLPSTGVPSQDRGRYYSFDWNGAHFVSLDSNLLGGPVEARMLSWLENDLKLTQKFWKIVFFHHTPYPSGHHVDDPLCILARDHILPIIEKQGVQLVLNGHEHSYQRTTQLLANTAVAPGYGTVYVNTSGGGGSLQAIGTLAVTPVALQAFHYIRVDIDGGQLTVRAIGLDGADLDRFSLAPKPLLSGISNASNTSAGLARGSLATINGLHISAFEHHPAGFARQMAADVSVTLNGAAVPVLDSSAHDFEILLPFDAPSSGSLHVQTANGSASLPLQLAEAAPVIIRMVSGQQALDSDRPAGAGTVVSILATGLGPVKGTLSAGLPAPGTALPVANPVMVSVAGHNVVPASATLVPGKQGLYDVRVNLPSGLSAGTYPVVLMVAGVPSPVSMLRVGARPVAPIRGDEAK